MSNSGVILALILVLTFIISVSSVEISAQTYTKQSYSEVVANSPFTIYAGKTNRYSFTIPSEAANAYLRGTMSITGGIFSTLDVAVRDSSGNTIYQRTFTGYGNVNVILLPGQTYWLTIRNGAILANDDKDVSPNFVLYYDKLIPTPIVNNPPSDSVTGGNMTDSMTGNMTGGNMTLGGADVTISPGSSSPSNGKNFVPDTLPVALGTTVTWNNGDTTLHTVTSGSPEGGNSGTEFDSSYIAAGKTFQHAFNTGGTFDYYCTLHPFMKGKIVVS